MSNRKKIKNKKRSIKDIAKAFEPSIDYLVQKGAEKIHIVFNEEKKSVSIYTPDVILSEKEMKELSETSKHFAAICKRGIVKSKVSVFM